MRRHPAILIVCGSIIGVLGLLRLTVLAQQAPAPVFRAGVDVIQLDVVVLDEAGQPVRGLTSRDFTVLENGRPQDVLDVTAVDLPGKPESAAQWMRDVGADVVSNEIGTQRFVVIVMDDYWMSFDPGVSKIAKTVAKAAIDELGPGDLAAVVFTCIGRNQNVTNDRGRLSAAVESLVPHPMAPQCVRRSVEALSRVAAILRMAPKGRKIVFYLGRGPAVGRRAFSDGTNVDVQAMFRSLLEANVAVYGFDPTGLRTGLSLDQKSAAANTAANFRPPLMNEGLTALAEHTGGRAVWTERTVEARR